MKDKYRFAVHSYASTIGNIKPSGLQIVELRLDKYIGNTKKVKK